MTGAEFILALNLYWEGATEPVECKAQIALVTVRRSKERKLSIYKTIIEYKQFSWTNDALDDDGNIKPRYLKPANKLRWRESTVIAQDVLRGKYIFGGGANHYYADYIQEPYWWSDIDPDSIFKCGKHIFGRIK